jgi:hypothetical protein
MKSIMPRRSQRIAEARAATAARAAAPPSPPPLLPMSQELAYIICETEFLLTDRSLSGSPAFEYPLTARYLLREDVPRILNGSVRYAQELVETRADEDLDAEEKVTAVRDILTRMRAFLNEAFDEEFQVFRQHALALVEAFIRKLSSFAQG